MMLSVWATVPVSGINVTTFQNKTRSTSTQPHETEVQELSKGYSVILSQNADLSYETVYSESFMLLKSFLVP